MPVHRAVVRLTWNHVSKVASTAHGTQVSEVLVPSEHSRLSFHTAPLHLHQEVQKCLLCWITLLLLMMLMRINENCW